MEWKRVTKKEPCSVCGHDSWCVYTSGAALCMRVESPRPKVFRDGTIGWLHGKEQTQSHPVAIHPTKKEVEQKVEWDKLINVWDQQTEHERLHGFARLLDVSYGALVSLSCCWCRSSQAWAFPMKDGNERVVGVRHRTVDGDKFAIRGSHQGLFVPLIKPERLLLVTEGPTDTAAALDLGYYAIGRPSCSGGSAQIKLLAMRQGVRKVIIVADNDEVGVKGAQSLVEVLPIACAIVVLPCKDLRQFKRLGGTKEMLNSRIDQSVWQNTA